MLTDLRGYLMEVSQAAFAASQALYYEKTPRANVFLQQGFSLTQQWPALSQKLAEQTEDSDFFPRNNALDLGRQFAVLTHCHLHLAVQRGLKQSGLYAFASDLESQLSIKESQYYFRLIEAKTIALNAQTEALDVLTQDCLHDVQTELYLLLENIGGLAKAQRGEKALSVRASRLARRYAMLLCALVYLRQRLITGSSRRGLKQVAERREKILRISPSLSLGQRNIAGFPEFSRITVIAYVSEHQWVDRPNIPYSKALVADYGYEIRVHRKDMNGHGVGHDSWIWVKGKVETEDDLPIFVSEFEGPGQHSGEYWEDWLADEVRQAYDLYPGVMHMEWEFPDIDKYGSMYDLVARTNDVLIEEDDNE